jgi:hypothetical protein
MAQQFLKFQNIPVRGSWANHQLYGSGYSRPWEEKKRYDLTRLGERQDGTAPLCLTRHVSWAGHAKEK